MALSAQYAENEPARAELEALAGPTLVFLFDGKERARLIRPADAGSIAQVLTTISP